MRPKQYQDQKAGGGNTYLNGPKVRQRYGISDMTLWRWRRDKRLQFPAPAMTVNRINYWLESDLEDFDRRHARVAA